MPRQLLIALLLTLSAVAAEAAAFKVVVNPANQTSTITRTELSAILMKRKPVWADGTPTMPVDQAEGSSVREVFSHDVHGKSVAAVKSYWRQQIFSGRDVPPREELTDAQVLAYVRSKPGAVGYVSENASLDGVKVIEVH